MVALGLFYQASLVKRTRKAMQLWGTMDKIPFCLTVSREGSMTNERPIKALGEIALRVNDVATMQQFYTNVVGLELLQRFPNSAFFKIAPGYGGHTQILALFDRTGRPGYQGVTAEKSSVDHIAFTIALADYETEKNRLERLGLTVTTAQHAWVHWRSLYIYDPEGNQVEWVCYDESVT